MRESVGWQAGRFVLLRTPLLPVEALDAAHARRGLCELVGDARVRRAIELAAPSLHRQLEAWSRDPDDRAAVDVERALRRYVIRMCSRPTPFGLFAGCTLGTVGGSTAIELAPMSEYRAHHELDGRALQQLARALTSSAEIRDALLVTVSSSANVRGGRVHFFEVHEGADPECDDHTLTSIGCSEAVSAVVERARVPRSLSELDALVETLGASAADARTFVDALVDAQLLVFECAPSLTSSAPLEDLRRGLPTEGAAAARLALEAAEADLRALDGAPLDAPPETPGIAALAAILPEPPTLHVDLWKPALRAQLGDEDLRAITRAADVLGAWRASREPLRAFCEQFEARYGDREVPLVDVLDERTGIDAFGDEPASPIVDSIVAAASDRVEDGFGARDLRLVELVVAAARHGRDEIELPDEPGGPRRPPRPGTAAALVALSEDGRILLDGITGPSAARLLGRFACGDAALRTALEDHVREEEALHGDAVLAEIVHHASGKAANTIRRPSLRSFEIPYLGRGSAPPERRIPVTDLAVAVRDGEVILRSMRLDRRVLPRIASAHGAHAASPRIYRFLLAVQDADGSDVRWVWGPLAALDELPAVRTGRVLLAPRRWRIAGRDLSFASAASPARALEALAAVRERRAIPRRVRLDSNDGLLFDLDDGSNVDALAHALRGRPEVVFVEPFAIETSVVREGERRFAHEIVVPLIRNAPRAVVSEAIPLSAREAPEVFLPGGEWIYAKIYGPRRLADRVLLEGVEPLVAKAREAGLADRWFFLRYADPEWHLRVRLHAVTSPGELLRELHDALAPWHSSGEIVRVQLDTYERELSRYGGRAAIAIAEEIFELDSAVALDVLRECDDDDEERWRAALAGVDQLLAAAGLSEPERARLSAEQAAGLRARLSVVPESERAFDRRYRAERAFFDSVLASEDAVDSPPSVAALREGDRQRVLVERLTRLRADREPGDRLFHEIVADLAHLRVNRFVAAEPLEHELAVYEMLVRWYRSRAARARRR